MRHWRSALAPRGHSAKAHYSLSEHSLTIVDAVILCLRIGDGSTATRILENLMGAMRGVCEICKSAKQPNRVFWVNEGEGPEQPWGSS